MFRILIATLAAVSLAGIGTADAAAKKKSTRYVAPARAITCARVSILCADTRSSVAMPQ